MKEKPATVLGAALSATKARSIEGSLLATLQRLVILELYKHPALSYIDILP